MCAIFYPRRALSRCQARVVILSTRMKDLGRYWHNEYENKPRHLMCSLGTLPYRFAQLIDQQEKQALMPLVEALSLSAYAIT